jgi:hypothetical protein
MDKISLHADLVVKFSPKIFTKPFATILQKNKLNKLSLAALTINKIEKNFIPGHINNRTKTIY